MIRLEVRCGALLALLVAFGCSDNPVGQPTGQSNSASGAAALSRGGVEGDSRNRSIAILDDCDPRDLNWASTGGCLLREGTVTTAEFGAELVSPLAASVVGHQAWRNEPSFLAPQVGKEVRVKNEGGRLHTFTEVASFGGGRIGGLNFGLLPAPECQPGAGAVDLVPGATQRITGLSVGPHRFQCCIHPWMRALIEVQPDDSGTNHVHAG